MKNIIFLTIATFMLMTHAHKDTYEDILLQELLNDIENGKFNEQDLLGDDYYSNIPYKGNYEDYIDLPAGVPDFEGNTLADMRSEDKISEDASDVPIPAQPRDNEYEAQNNKWGYQYMSGGAGEVDSEGNVKDPDKQEVKTDAGLPSYCNPPNPCPKGKSSKTDNCQDNVPDTSEFNQRYVQWQMRRGDCGCDTEHMFPDSCPKGAEKISTRPEQAENKLDDIDSLISEMLGIESESDNPYVSHGEKRATLVAKKGSAPRSKRSTGTNPYLQGEKLGIVAKKAPPMEHMRTSFQDPMFNSFP